VASHRLPPDDKHSIFFDLEGILVLGSIKGSLGLYVIYSTYGRNPSSTSIRIVKPARIVAEKKLAARFVFYQLPALDERYLTQPSFPQNSR
jgi:hypothetical protein